MQSIYWGKTCFDQTLYKTRQERRDLRLSIDIEDSGLGCYAV